MAQLAAFAQPVVVTLTGSTVTLTEAQSSSQYIVFKGTPGTNAVATITGNPSSGFVSNFTTGGYTVEITTGTGSTVTLANNATYAWTCDGTNVSILDLSFSSLDVTTLGVSGNAVVSGSLDVLGATSLSSTLGVTGAASLGSSLGVTGNATVGGNLGVTGNATVSGTVGITGTATAANGTTGTELVNFSQFPATLAVAGSEQLPNGRIRKWGTGTITLSAAATWEKLSVTFPTAFPHACFGVRVTQASSGTGTTQPLNSDGSYAIAPENFVTNRTTDVTGFDVWAYKAASSGKQDFEWEAVGW